MTYVRTILIKYLSGAVRLQMFWIALFAMATWSQFTLAAQVTPLNTFSAKVETAPLPDGNNKVRVQWLKTTYQQIDRKRARVLLFGKARPGTKIKFATDAVAIDSHFKTHNLTVKEMQPNQKAIVVGTSGQFKILLNLPFGHVQIPFLATRPPLKAQPYVILLLLKRHEHLKFNMKPHRLKGASKWDFGFELRSVSYQQTNLNHLNEKMFTMDVTYQHTFTKEWAIMAQSFIDVAGDIPFSTNQNEMYARYWHGNFDEIYALPLNSNKWSIGVAAGLYYMTMLPSGLNFGYGDLWGPEIYPIFSYSFDNKNAFNFYFKYAPNMSKFSPNFTNYESAAGIKWVRLYNNKRLISIGIEMLQDVFKIGDLSSESNAVNFGISMGIP